MAYYNVLFDRCVDEAFELLGIGADYLEDRAFSTFTAEAHVRYLRELHEGDPVRVTFQLLDYDYQAHALFRAALPRDDGWVSATSENMTLHVDMAAKKTAPFPDEVTRRLIADEGRARPAAAARSGGPQHRDAGQELDARLNTPTTIPASPAPADARRDRGSRCCGRRATTRCVPSIATPREARCSSHCAELVLADGEGDMQRPRAVVAGNGAARHGHGLRRRCRARKISSTSRPATP